MLLKQHQILDLIPIMSTCLLHNLPQQSIRQFPPSGSSQKSFRRWRTHLQFKSMQYPVTGTNTSNCDVSYGKLAYPKVRDSQMARMLSHVFSSNSPNPRLMKVSFKWESNYSWLVAFLLRLKKIIIKSLQNVNVVIWRAQVFIHSYVFFTEQLFHY